MPSQNPAVTPTCPRCNSSMILRHSARGPFYGCRKYPSCRGLVDVKVMESGTGSTGSIPTTFGAPAIDVPWGARAAENIPARTIQLDTDQETVCAWRQGEAVAAAAAGSGKSTVLVERTAELLAEGFLPETILILTFNKDAAVSLRGKLMTRLGTATGKRIRAYTYHAYCLALLRAWWPDDQRFQNILGSDGQPTKQTLFRSIIRDLRVEGERLEGDADDWISPDERLREAGIDFESEDEDENAVLPLIEKSARCGTYLAKKLFAVGRAFAQLKLEKKVCDFSDFLVFVAREMRKDSDLAKRAGVFSHVMVDEAQDTNTLQQQIALYLGLRARSLLWVGDLRQSIYGFRGAEPKLLVTRTENGAALLPIRTCRRSTAEIVEAGNAIARGQDWHLGGDSVARPNVPPGSLPVVCSFDSGAVASQVASGIADGAAPSDYAVLARVNSALPDFECSLVARGFPVRVLGAKGGVWETQIGKLVRAYLWASEGRLTSDFSRITNRPLRYISAEVVKTVTERVGKGSKLIDALQVTGNRGAARMVWDLKKLEKAEFNERCDTVEELLILDAEERAAGLKQEPDEDRIETISALCQAAKLLQSAQAIEDQIKEMQKTKDETPAVTLATTHRSKGLEWKHVYVLAEKKHFPHINADDHAEELRLWYVATTRAAETLTYFFRGEASSYLEDMGSSVRWMRRPDTLTVPTNLSAVVYE